jgi:hypothetical protein
MSPVRAGSSEPNPGIEVGVDDVDGQVDEREQKSGNQDDRLDRGVVPLKDGIRDHPTYPWEAENLLDYDGTANQVASVHAHQGDDWDTGIIDGLPCNDTRFE